MGNTTKIVLGFIAGVAAGAVISEVLRTEKGKDIINEVEGLAQKVKKNVQDLTDMANSYKSKASAAAKDAQAATDGAAQAAGGTNGAAGS